MAVVADAALGVFNQAEVVSHFVHLGAPVKETHSMLAAFAVLAADEELSWDAGALRAVTSSAGLSLGDRFCLALSKRLGVPAYIADRAWKDVASDVGVRVAVIR